MSRSYHITKREAARRFVYEGDAEALLAYAEKKTLKDVVKEVRDVYGDLHHSSKEPNELTGRMAHRVMKVLTQGKAETAAQIVADKERVEA